MSELSLRDQELLRSVEHRIQRLLLGLDERLISERLRIDFVDVDTRNFANMKTEIHTVARVSK